MSQWILVLNAGSSSLKFALVNGKTAEEAFSGLAECLGADDARVTFHSEDGKQTLSISDGAMETAISMMMATLPLDKPPIAIGHRVVHGGERFRQAVLIDDDVLAGIDACSSLAPLHNPANLQGIEAARRLFPALLQVAVFDTAFHSGLPEKAYHYAIPIDLYDKFGVRRYGFHGTSHHYVAMQAADILHQPFNETQVISAHLGNGCSVTAVKGGQSIDTSMGMTPLEGVVMGTRSGDVDPGIIFWLAEQQAMSVEKIGDLLNKKSGLLGLSALSNDMRTLEEASANGHHGAQLAIDVFCYRLAKTISALTVGLDRLDALIFTGGIGENSRLIRQTVTDQLALLNLHSDPDKNANNGDNTKGHIERDGSVPVLVIPTDEEYMIASQTLALI
ncbi:Acetate kinase [BD1-7 clade bacterium]|uniref:Acetate kinase n=1 Tax=BD1-7 clade bacterium TaxID=2029982 RepID=A0A5S9QFW4_9GAMM|nr:Acetate kinase [BD1-7 clade bacterium]CAA0117498.1 Acetate kinase [BD1-7 clade bacterium]